MVIRGCMENLWVVKGELKVVNFLWYLRQYVIPCKSHIKDGHNLKSSVWWKIAVFCSSLFIVCNRFHSFKTKVKHMKCFKALSVIDDYTLEVTAVTALRTINLLRFYCALSFPVLDTFHKINFLSLMNFTWGFHKAEHFKTDDETLIITFFPPQITSSRLNTS